jgi:hypothetical protein
VRCSVSQARLSGHACHELGRGSELACHNEDDVSCLHRSCVLVWRGVVTEVRLLESMVC